MNYGGYVLSYVATNCETKQRPFKLSKYSLSYSLIRLENINNSVAQRKEPNFTSFLIDNKTLKKKKYSTTRRRVAKYKERKQKVQRQRVSIVLPACKTVK